MANNSVIDKIKTQFKENKQLRTITFAVGAVLLILVGYIVYQQFVFGPKNDKSKESYYRGLNLAAQDSTDAAIAELEPVVKKFDGTIGGEVAKFTLARQYMNKENFKKALTLLEDVSLEDTYGPALILGLQGDCNSELKKYKEAIELYVKAADASDNEFTAPTFLFKAGLAAEEINDKAKAKECYERIRDNYTAFAQQKTIEKYIARVSTEK